MSRKRSRENKLGDVDDSSKIRHSHKPKKREKKDSLKEPVDPSLDSTKTEKGKESRPIDFDYRYILAPMVGASELAFRLLCRKYGAQAAYTPMMSAESFATSEEYRTSIFQTLPDKLDYPLVCHFSANEPQAFAKAAKYAQDHCGASAIDLNLGCPQRTAYVGHFGSYLLDPKDRKLVLDILKAATKAVSIPVFCKIRLLDTYEDTKKLVSELWNVGGVSLIAIHARYRASWQRQGPGARDGPALLDQIAKLKEELPEIRIVTNGNTTTFSDVESNLALTGADGLMSAEGLLDNPALYLSRHGDTDSDEQVSVVDGRLCGAKSTEMEKTSTDEASLKLQRKRDKLLKKLGKVEAVKAKKKRGADLSSKDLELLGKERKWTKKRDKVLAKIGEEATHVSPNTTFADGRIKIPLNDLFRQAVDKVALAQEYLDLVRKHPASLRTIIFHVRRMCKQELEQYQLLEDCLSSESINDVEGILNQVRTYRTHPDRFVHDKAKAKQQKEALERKKHEEGKRKRYEDRMRRKAKREGKLDDLEYYLRQGAAIPTKEIIQQLKNLSGNKAEQVKLWKESDHFQHCMAYHTEGECPRGRTCAFLHMDTKGSHTFDEQSEVAG